MVREDKRKSRKQNGSLGKLIRKRIEGGNKRRKDDKDRKIKEKLEGGNG